MPSRKKVVESGQHQLERAKFALRVLVVAAGAALVSMAASERAIAQTNKATIGYQLVYNPWKVAIKQGAFEAESGYEIKWRQYDSGSKVIAALASGEVDIAMAGSSPIAAGISRGIQLQLFWIAEDIASAEALVAREGSGISAPQDLKGKRIAAPFASTTHFHLLFALEQFGIDAGDVTLVNMQPLQIVEAWEGERIDAAFVWDPALGRIKRSGRVLITSGRLSSWGKATFDGMVARPRFVERHGEFMTDFVRLIAAADESYRSNKAAWTAESPEVEAIAEMVGGDPSDVPAVLELYTFPSLAEQASCRWLGCGSQSGAARALKFTSQFLKSEGKITDLRRDYSQFVTARFVEAVLRQSGE